MTVDEIKKKIHGDEYSFLESNQYLGKNIILIGLGGSYAYGTNNAESDLDLRGIATNTREYILTGKDFEQVVDVNTDTTVYSFDKIVKLLCSCNPNVIELLGLKSDHYIYMSEIGKMLLDNKQLFLSKKAVHTFGGYADAQLRRLENKAARKSDQSRMEEHIFNSIKNASYVFRQRYFDVDDDEIKLYIDRAVQPGFDTEIFMDINLKHYPLRDYVGMWSEMSAIVRQYAKFGRRNENAIAHNKLAKHMMHLVRLYLMCFDILENGEVITYREKDHDYLMEIRNGKYLDEYDQPTKEFYDIVTEYENRLAYLSEHTDLPDKADEEKIDKLTIKVNEIIVGAKTNESK